MLMYGTVTKTKENWNLTGKKINYNIDMQVLAWWSIPWSLLKWLVQCVLADFCRFLGDMDMHMKKKTFTGTWMEHEVEREI